MFESAAFLCAHLPEHFKRISGPLKNTYSSFDSKFLENAGDFALMSRNLFDGPSRESLLCHFLVCSFLEESGPALGLPSPKPQIASLKHYVSS